VGAAVSGIKQTPLPCAQGLGRNTSHTTSNMLVVLTAVKIQSA